MSPLVPFVARELHGGRLASQCADCHRSLSSTHHFHVTIPVRTVGLPMLARLIVHDCPRMIAAQHDLLGRLALAATRRRNFGLLSLYRTDLGGQQLLPDWSIPRYSAITLAGAGRFFILRSNQATAEPTVR